MWTLANNSGNLYVIVIQGLLRSKSAKVFCVVGERDRARLPDLSLARLADLILDLFLAMPQRSHAEVCDS